ncbi:MAG: SPOR domain-containing protein [Burkholderiaceae bacterium]|nr:SPOR domain-containing protein [Burkholderiaceae bacterium]
MQRAAGGGYLLQLGVFHNTASAEELRATLELNGIPAQIESRVQVGPFANRAEAEQAREKLKKLGLEGGMLVTTKK